MLNYQMIILLYDFVFEESLRFYPRAFFVALALDVAGDCFKKGPNTEQISTIPGIYRFQGH